MSDPTLTHKDLAALLGVSETTVKSYRRKFPGCIPVASKGKPIRFTRDAAAVATRIRDLFETGMSVEEVRARLTAEFGWIGPPEPSPVKERSKSGTRTTDVGPELSHGVSNMAKSLVAVTQQQKIILSRIQGIESLLEDLGADSPAEMADKRAEVAGKRAEAVRQRESQFEERLATLDRLDAMVTTLAANLQDLAGRLDSLLARRAKTSDEWDTGNEVAKPAKGTCPPDERPQDRQQDRQWEGAKVFPLRPHEAPPPEPEPGREPERRFFSLPLVARTDQGRFLSAGGKGRGPFSLNDLKAMLIYGFTPPDHFTLRFTAHGQGWWLTLEQKTSGRVIRLLLTELPSQRGGSVAEILQIVSNGDSIHPVEICGIIDSFSA